MLFILLNLDLFRLIWNNDLDTLHDVLRENLFMTLAITLFLMIIQNTFTLIPLLLLITLNITLFGFVYGFLWSWATSLAGGAAVFLAARHWFQDFLVKKANQKFLDNLEKNGMLYVFTGRVFPFFPTSLVNLTAAISSIRFSHYMWGTAAGNLIYFFFMALIPLGLLSTGLNEYLLGGIVLLIVIILAFYKKIKKKKSPAGN